VLVGALLGCAHGDGRAGSSLVASRCKHKEDEKTVLNAVIVFVILIGMGFSCLLQ